MFEVCRGVCFARRRVFVETLGVYPYPEFGGNLTTVVQGSDDSSNWSGRTRRLLRPAAPDQAALPAPVGPTK